MLRTSILALGFSAFLLVPPAVDNDQDAPREAAELELHVGKQAFDVVAERPITFETPKGEKVTVVVRHKSAIEHKGQIVSLRCPRGCRVQEKPNGVFVSTEIKDTSSVVVTVLATRGEFDGATHVDPAAPTGLRA